MILNIKIDRKNIINGTPTCESPLVNQNGICHNDHGIEIIILLTAVENFFYSSG